MQLLKITVFGDLGGLDTTTLFSQMENCVKDVLSNSEELTSSGGTTKTLALRLREPGNSHVYNLRLSVEFSLHSASGSQSPIMKSGSTTSGRPRKRKRKRARG